MAKSVWIDWGSAKREDVREYTFDSEKECNAFLWGVTEAAEAWGLDDFRQYDSLREVEESFEDE